MQAEIPARRDLRAETGLALSRAQQASYRDRLNALRTTPRELVVRRGALLQEPLELAGADGVLELANGLGLHLADALARDLEDPPDLLQRVGVAVADAVAELDDLALAVGEGLEHFLDAVLEHLGAGGLDGVLGRLVLDEVAEVAVLALADGPVEADGVPRDLQHAPRLRDAHAGLLGDLLDG